jgi:hypothetical protein
MTQKYPKVCWKCKTELRLKKMIGGEYGLYCPKCTRYRRYPVVPQEVRGVGWSIVDVRRSGALKRKVYLGEILR